MAQTIAHDHGLKLTPTNREVLALVSRAGQPQTAYQILHSMQQQRKASVQPPTVYRALSWLTSKGLVHRLESLNAFIACADSGHVHSGQFMICDSCGRTEEFDDERITSGLNEVAAARRFAVSRQTVEIRGVCGDCAQLSS